MRLSKLIGGVALLVVLVVGLVLIANATQYTLTATQLKVGGVAYMRYSHTFAATTDTIIIPFRWSANARGSNPVGQVVIGTVSANGDSVDISVRYQQSTDNTNWQSFTLGTDSTTWVSAVTTGYTITTSEIDQTTHGGWFPYSRLYIIGNAGNLAGGGIRVWLIDNTNR